MALAKVVEVVAEGASIEAAVAAAVRDAFSSLGNAGGASVDAVRASVLERWASGYLVAARVTFRVGH